MYSLHKYETLDYLKKFYAKNKITDLNAFKMQYDLPKSYKFHKKANKTIDVLCLEADVTGIDVINFE